MDMVSAQVTPSVTPLVLAAGASSRMGRCKAALPFGATTSLGLILETCTAAGLAPAVVVAGAEAEAVRAVAGDARVVVNAAWESGRTTSILAGLAVISGDVLLWPVDACLPPLEVVQALLAAREANAAALAWVPSYGQRRGHPLLLSAQAAERLRGLGPEQSAREVVRGLHDSGSLVHVETDEGSVLQNMNTPEDYERWSRAYAERKG